MSFMSPERSNLDLLPLFLIRNVPFMGLPIMKETLTCQETDLTQCLIPGLPFTPTLLKNIREISRVTPVEEFCGVNEDHFYSQILQFVQVPIG